MIILKKRDNTSKEWKYVLVDIEYLGKYKAGTGSRDANALVDDDVSVAEWSSRTYNRLVSVDRICIC